MIARERCEQQSVGISIEIRTLRCSDRKDVAWNAGDGLEIPAARWAPPTTPRVSSRTEQEEMSLTSHSRETPERRGLDLTKNVRGEDSSNITLPESIGSSVRND